MRRTRRHMRPYGAKQQLLACFLSIFLSLIGWSGAFFWPSQPFTSVGLSLTAPSSSLLAPTAAPEPVITSPPIALAASPHTERAQLAAYVGTAAPSQSSIRAPVERTIKKGDTAISIFRQAGVDMAQAMQLHQAVRSVYDLQRLRIGQPYRLEVSPDGQVDAFSYVIDNRRRLDVVRKNRTFVGRMMSISYKRSERVVAGSVNGSMYASLRAQGETSQLISDFADIFAWSVDFATDLRQGDTYRLLIEEHSHNGNAPQYHRILAAELINRKRTLQTIYYHKGDLKGYYRPDGRSMQGMFLRSPLRYTRISSRFSHRRFHPILKRYRPHLGVDYAAPIGTPVRSVAAGTVTWVGRQGGGGKTIKIRHNRSYMTYYLHLSRYARGIRQGTRVRQGQIIGYVGSTGLSTGPHLDFRLRKNGKFINPLHNNIMEGPPVPKKALRAFRAHAKQLLTKLAQVQLAMQQEGLEAATAAD